MRKIIFFALALSIGVKSIAQDEAGSVYIGGNFGAYFGNKNTAIMYTGGNVTNYGVEYVFNNINFKPDIDLYFQYPYEIVELPINPAYRPAMDIGLHAGVHLGNGNSLYADFNSSRLNFEQFFTVAIEDPNNLSPDPTYEQIPLFGEERRFNINIGTQISLYNENSINWYMALFGNLNNTRLEKNYFVLNGRQYLIWHGQPGTPNVNPGGMGYGGGAGTGVKYYFNDTFTFDLTYNLYYNKIRMNEDFQPFGMHHGMMLRIIWG